MKTADLHTSYTIPKLQTCQYALKQSSGYLQFNLDNCNLNNKSTNYTKLHTHILTQNCRKICIYRQMISLNISRQISNETIDP